MFTSNMGAGKWPGIKTEDGGASVITTITTPGARARKFNLYERSHHVLRCVYKKITAYVMFNTVYLSVTSHSEESEL